MTREETLAHLEDRGVLPFLYPDMSVGEGVVTFPLYEFGGRMVGYQDYRPFAERNCRNVREARYFTYLPRTVNGYFGLQSLFHSTGRFFVVEGVFKATKLHRLGLPALSLMGSETRQHMAQLNILNRPYVGIGDADPAGAKFAHKLNGYTSPRDLDEMTDVEVMEMLRENYQ